MMKTVYFDKAAEIKEQPKEKSISPSIQTDSCPKTEPLSASSLKSAPNTSKLSESATVSPTKTQPKSEIPKAVKARLKGAAQTRALKPSRESQRFVFRPSGPCWLTISGSQRRISLPATGELILGRFDPHRKDPLDVDLTFEDQETRAISRRHARVAGSKGYHTIEDLGSNNGLFVNGIRVKVGQAQPLQPNDYIVIGELELHYEPVPDEFLAKIRDNASSLRSHLKVAYSGRKIDIAPPNSIAIGRANPGAAIVPNIDVTQDGEVAICVSRRHAVITWSGHKPYLKDVGSTFGTRLNGELLKPHQMVALDPGDHISLGGCVLVYDVKAIKVDRIPLFGITLENNQLEFNR